MPQCECTRRTPTDDDMDTSAGRGIVLRGREVANVGNVMMGMILMIMNSQCQQSGDVE